MNSIVGNLGNCKPKWNKEICGGKMSRKSLYLGCHWRSYVNSKNKHGHLNGGLFTTNLQQYCILLVTWEFFFFWYYCGHEKQSAKWCHWSIHYFFHSSLPFLIQEVKNLLMKGWISTAKDFQMDCELICTLLNPRLQLYTMQFPLSHCLNVYNSKFWNF